MKIFLLIKLILSFALISQQQRITPSTNNENVVVAKTEKLQMRNIETLEGHCETGVCRNFYFENPHDVAFFDLKERVRINEHSSTYDIISPLEYKVMRFENSTFANFPLHLFYTIDIHELDIRNCGVQRMTWESFLMAGNLNVLVMSDNLLKTIEEMTFNYASELQFLLLDSNRLHKLVSESFKGLDKLTYLGLSNNRLVTLPTGMFDYLPRLQHLTLNGNRLRTITSEMFASNANLMIVQLNDNKLQSIHDDAFKMQKKLSILDVSNNEALEMLIANMQVNNLVAQNCSLERINIYGEVNNAQLADNHIMELYFAQPEGLEILNLRNNSLEQIASLAHAFKLQTLDLSNNPNLFIDEAYDGMYSLERLDLSNTNLTMLPIELLDSLSKLISLNVSHNNLAAINPLNFKYLDQLKHFYIHANNWNCYNLNLLMDVLIKPNGISYTRDEFDDSFPGQYIGGIACMYRIEDQENDDDNNNASVDVIGDNVEENEVTSAMPIQMINDQYMTEIQNLRNELKAINGLYEQKFDRLIATINDLSARLRKFEEFVGEHVTITT